nr:hypothetical protein Iba_chr02eCG6350 [Ipomoea batatas]
MEQGSGGDLPLQCDDSNNEELQAATAAWWQQAAAKSFSPFSVPGGAWCEAAARLGGTPLSVRPAAAAAVKPGSSPLSAQPIAEASGGCFSHSLLLYCCCHIPRTVDASHIPLPVVVSSFHCLLLFLQFSHSSIPTLPHSSILTLPLLLLLTFHYLFLNSHTATVAASHIPLPVAVSSFHSTACCSYIKEMANTTYPSSSDNSSFWDDIIVSPLRDSAQSIDLTVVENFENPPLESNEIIASPGATGTDVVVVDQGTTVVVEEDNTTTALDVATMNARVFRGRKRTRRTFCDTTTLTFEKFSEYFYLPSEQAAEELQVSLNLIP